MNSIKRKYYEWKLNYMQKKVNKEYEEKGFNDDILEKQIQINQKRHELNIVDPNELIYNEFVQ